MAVECGYLQKLRQSPQRTIYLTFNQRLGGSQRWERVLWARCPFAENCATESAKLAADHAAEGISGKIRGGDASSAVTAAAGCLTGKLKSIEGTLNEHSGSLLQTARDVGQTDQAEAGAYAGLTAFGEAGNDGVDGESGVSAIGVSGAPGVLGADEGQLATNEALAGIYELMGPESSKG